MTRCVNVISNVAAVERVGVVKLIAHNFLRSRVWPLQSDKVIYLAPFAVFDIQSDAYLLEASRRCQSQPAGC